MKKAVINIILFLYLSGCMGCATTKANLQTSHRSGFDWQYASDGVCALMLLPIALVFSPVIITESIERNDWEKRFSQLEAGMSREQVRKIMGRPGQISKDQKSGWEVWQYQLLMSGEKITFSFKDDLYQGVERGFKSKINNQEGLK